MKLFIAVSFRLCLDPVHSIPWGPGKGKAGGRVKKGKTAEHKRKKENSKILEKGVDKPESMWYPNQALERAGRSGDGRQGKNQRNLKKALDKRNRAWYSIKAAHESGGLYLVN